MEYVLMVVQQINIEMLIKFAKIVYHNVQLVIMEVHVNLVYLDNINTMEDALLIAHQILLSCKVHAGLVILHV